MDQPVKVANSARGQLKGEDIFLPVPDRAFEFGRARRASAIPFCVSLLISTLYWYVDVRTAEILNSKTFFFVPRRKAGQQLGIKVQFGLHDTRLVCLKKNHNAPRPSEHLPVMGGKMSKRLGGIKGLQIQYLCCCCCCCCPHTKSRSDLYSVLSNIRTGPTDANAFRGHRLTTQKGYTLCEKKSKRNKRTQKSRHTRDNWKRRKIKNKKRLQTVRRRRRHVRERR